MSARLAGRWPRPPPSWSVPQLASAATRWWSALGIMSPPSPPANGGLGSGIGGGGGGGGGGRSRRWRRAAARAAAVAAGRARRALRAPAAGWVVAAAVGVALLVCAAHTRRLVASCRVLPAALEASFVGEGVDGAAAAEEAVVTADVLTARRAAAAVAGLGGRMPVGADPSAVDAPPDDDGVGRVGGRYTLGNQFCVLQPTLSAGRTSWSPEDVAELIGLRAFMTTFLASLTPGELRDYRFAVYYGHDSDDPVFGSARLRAAHAAEVDRLVANASVPAGAVRLAYTPLYALHGRITAIWNVLAKDAYYDGCDYFFLSNDDMVIYTRGWVQRAVDSLNGIGSRGPSKRPCRHFGLVRFRDEWKSWATFTFHVGTRLHMEIFGGVYYPVPYLSAHNDDWIHRVYGAFNASKFRSEVRVRNRVSDVAAALARKGGQVDAPPRYDYDVKVGIMKNVHAGRAVVKQWLDKHRGDERFCAPPL